MPDDLYDRDILDWADQQAALLRRLAAGERVNDAIDWAHVIEEVQDVGLSELHAVKSLLRQAMSHLIKLRLQAEARVAPHWRGEIVAFLADAADRFVPSMRQRIDLDRIWRLALRQVAVERRRLPGGLPQTCLFTLDELLAEDADPAALAARIGAP